MPILTITSKWTWYVARSGGLVAWATCTASIVWGLLLSTRLVQRKGIPAWLLDLHRFLGTLTLAFTAIHLAGLAFDSYAPFGPSALFVPMASTWKPGPVAWGIVALYVLVAIEVTSWLMRRIPRRWWHAIHLSSVVLFLTSTVHAFTAGSDRMNLAVQWIALVATMTVVFLTIVRVLSPRSTRAPAATSPTA